MDAGAEEGKGPEKERKEIPSRAMPRLLILSRLIPGRASRADYDRGERVAASGEDVKKKKMMKKRLRRGEVACGSYEQKRESRKGITGDSILPSNREERGRERERGRKREEKRSREFVKNSAGAVR